MVYTDIICLQDLVLMCENLKFVVWEGVHADCYAKLTRVPVQLALL